MTAPPKLPADDVNQRQLAASLTSLKAILSAHARQRLDAAHIAAAPDVDASAPALDHVASAFGLTSFERRVLLLAAGMELDSAFAPLCAAASADGRTAWPTFGLALAIFDDAHWSALSPQRPLRFWRLVELDERDGLTSGRLRIDERIVHFLTCVATVDERLDNLVEKVPLVAEIPRSQQSAVEGIIDVWSRAAPQAPLPTVQISARDDETARLVARRACVLAGLELYALDGRDVPAGSRERGSLIRLLEREAALGRMGLLIECRDDASDAVISLVRRLRAPVLISARAPLHLDGVATVRFDLGRPSPAEQRELWSEALGKTAAELNGELEAIVRHFDFDRPHIAAATFESASAPSLWHACRRVARPRLDDLAQRIEPTARWDDLVLPIEQKQTLREIEMHVRHRVTVYFDWGFAEKSGRGLGITALFSGASGTGKTMAAEVLARELRLDLYRVDLSAVVSKYIGETEKNLRRVFDAAEAGGAILLFDEADALFGKRSEVKDSHDRYANIEVGYLLQRMETYRGLAILTSNMKSALDTSFLRRIRFVVDFPFPDFAVRREIWRRQFPERCPTYELDVNRLAQLNISGGSIFNIAVRAAFLAAEDDGPVLMSHVLLSAQTEYTNLQKPLTRVEKEGWE